ncbi:hypothetical protein Pcinc_014208 [Petrolisthes cinctipes]|uniref:Carbohydrate sulfotransferase n=1 Tax=Petrolisthes cinctipes TaxID=88211 RepID=A0AAE1FX12_PETCI|nr:hypothetical protein Pcinc_014208 [Petrolisthes cinctipes]
MACRLRVAVWGLAALTIFTCLASVRWFLLSSTLTDQKLPMTVSLPEEVVQPSPVIKTMEWRRAALERGCQQLEKWSNSLSLDPLTQYSLDDTKKLNNLIVDDKHKVLYCYVPKVACTNWKKMMLMLTRSINYSDPQSIPSDSVHRKNVFIKLSDLEPEEIQLRLRTYSKFLFVRHPIERLVSAFRNKFEKNYTSSAYFKKRFGMKIMRKYRTGVDPSLLPANGHGVKFSEFTSYLIDTKPNQFNEHWAPMSSMCHPCFVRYDYIGKYETLAEDAEYILRQIGAPPSLHFPEVVPSKTTAHVDSYFDMLSSKQQPNLIKIYEDDFRIFDYHYRYFI